MALRPTIKLYRDEDNPTIIVQKFVPFKTLKELIKMTAPLRGEIEDVGDIDDSQFDTLCEMVSVLFRGKVTPEELEEYADIDDIFQCFLNLGKLSTQYSQNQQNKQNHPARSRRKKKTRVNG